MQTITPDYADLNRKLHESSAKWGTGSWRWAQDVLDLREQHGAETVLDYGCGKGKLKIALDSPDWMAEYDPAIEGKQDKPAFVDMVVCTDVLEHIEPDLIDNVLTDIRKTATKVAFLVIATRPAKAVLPDGTNAHKIIQNADWWRAKLAETFFIASFDHVSGELKAVVSPIRKVGEIVAKSAVAGGVRLQQALRNSGIVTGRVGKQPRHDGRVCIVAYGPSLKDTWHTLRMERRAFGAKIVSVSGAHDFLIERGIVPDYHIEVDPREHKAHFTRNPHPEVTYLIASCCHPVLIDNLVERGSKLALWHVYNSEDDFNLVNETGPDPGGWLICGGGSVGCRAVNVMYTQGYRTFSMYGMDCSFDASGEQHAGEHSGKKQHEWNVQIGNRWFRTSATLVYTARGFMGNVGVLQRASEDNNEPFIEGTKDRIEFFMSGDGLLQELARATEQAAAAA